MEFVEHPAYSAVRADKVGCGETVAELGKYQDIWLRIQFNHGMMTVQDGFVPFVNLRTGEPRCFLREATLWRVVLRTEVYTGHN